MKKVFLILAMAFAAVTVMTSCSDNITGALKFDNLE